VLYTVRKFCISFSNDAFHLSSSGKNTDFIIHHDNLHEKISLYLQNGMSFCLQWQICYSGKRQKKYQIHDRRPKVKECWINCWQNSKKKSQWRVEWSVGHTRHACVNHISALRISLFSPPFLGANSTPNRARTFVDVRDPSKTMPNKWWKFQVVRSSRSRLMEYARIFALRFCLFSASFWDLTLSQIEVAPQWTIQDLFRKNLSILWKFEHTVKIWAR